MENVFVVNPSATKDQLRQAMEARVGQASGICAAMSTSTEAEDGAAIGRAFWAVEHLIDEIFELHRAIDRKKGNRSGSTKT